MTILTLFSLLVIMILCTSAMAGPEDFWKRRHTVHVINDIDDDSRPLIVHCKSGNDDLGEHSLRKGEEYIWTFHINFFGTTLFFCRFYWDDEKNRLFDSFKIQETQTCDTFERGGHYYWAAKSDGIYFSCRGSAYRKRCEWDQNIECST
ncbi:hypothetical protein RND81_01G032800 [Saponaria officinalis]|uniref:S-protein homolog n=1 Tax=Saponaria officinalis TaxID=3572 RepID=A0AAW1NFT5_SAPOF